MSLNLKYKSPETGLTLYCLNLETDIIWGAFL